MDISFSGELADHYMQKAIVMTLSAVDALKRLFFVANLFDSLKVSGTIVFLQFQLLKVQGAQIENWSLYI